jgi:hypothetical protein
VKFNGTSAVFTVNSPVRSRRPSPRVPRPARSP